MLYHIETEERTAAGHSSTVYTLTRPDIGSLAEIWPAHGFNCLHWTAGGRNLLYSASDWNENPLPTRSGVPILFPFPNRIRGGQFVHDGKMYRLPKNDSTHANAIHGFAPRAPWRVMGYGVDAHGAWLHGDFRISADAPEAADLWPGDGVLSVVYRLSEHRLRIEMRVQNIGAEPFPFGIGLHPYFRITNEPDVSRYVLHAPARSIWALTENLPVGERQSLPDDLNWNRPRMVGGTRLDTVYGDLGVIEEEAGNLLLRAMIGHVDQPGRLELWTSPAFREAVLFTPPHRQAICVEPYTCVTDAANLQARGINAGWRVLGIDETFTGVVEIRWNPAE
ncbi:MAG TPA: aldose 1-epimerase [Gemmataceae bacterium]|jgi:aldose 1-epimerase|nr:aldose 1-epimerase [Gemmataceae bacterium]